MKKLILILGVMGLMSNSQAIDKKLVQVKVFVGSTDDLNINVNDFLKMNKISRNELLDIKFTTCESYRRAMVIYEVNMDN